MIIYMSDDQPKKPYWSFKLPLSKLYDLDSIDRANYRKLYYNKTLLSFSLLIEMKLTKELKRKVDKYFNNITAEELYKILTKKYNMPTEK